MRSWLSFFGILALLISNEVNPVHPYHQRPDKRARYLDTYVVKNTEVRYDGAPGDGRYFQHRLSSRNGNPVVSQYNMQRHEIPLGVAPGPFGLSPFRGGSPPIEPEGQPLNSAVAQSCEGALCINLRSGLAA